MKGKLWKEFQMLKFDEQKELQMKSGAADLMEFIGWGLAEPGRPVFRQRFL